MQLENVSDEIVTNDLEGKQESILSPIKEKALDVSSIVAQDDAQGLRFYKNLVSKGSSSER